jgi:ribosomal-protein-alanine N-acetyltransferase
VLLVPPAAEDPVDLLRIAVSPAERRTGIGGQLTTAALRRCAGRTVLLEVAAGNESAGMLYRSFGFAEISRRRGYYAGGEDAVIMRWQEKVS